ETDEKEKKLDNGHEKRSTSPSEISHRNESSIVITEKRRRGRPKKSEKTDEGGKWSDVSAKNTGKFDLPLPVPESWPLVNNMEEIMTELAEMYSNVKVEKRGEFHNQIKAFVFALHWEDGSFSTSGKRKRGRPPKAHKSEASTPAPKPYTPGKRGRPPKNRVIVPA
ncbi:hypothetical protein ANCDUO_18215, partial [Ancylostoma duodenale]